MQTDVMHQIRVRGASAGLVILEDELYGGGCISDGLASPKACPTLPHTGLSELIAGVDTGLVGTTTAEPHQLKHPTAYFNETL